MWASGSRLTFDDVLEIKDAGIQYHRSGIGLKNKGGNDLYERIFSSNKKEFKNNRPTWYGKLIEEYILNSQTDEYFNLDFKEVLKKNESVSYSKEAFLIKNKILWRQTASRLIATIDYHGKWFRNTIQCAWVKEQWEQKISLEYCLAVCNSKLISYYYNQIVREAGRVFPQVKIKHVKKLPFVLIDDAVRKQFYILVSYMLLINKKYSDEKTLLLKIIDAMVYELYFPDEIKAADAGVLKHLTNLPELKDSLNDEQQMKTIEKVYQELSDPKHSVAIAMVRQKTVKEVRIIEGLDK